jgi:phosphatidylglycerophosphatase A
MLNQKIEENRAKRGQKPKINGAVDATALFVATGFGVGFIPFAPGTWGSLVGLLIAYGLIRTFSLNVILLQNVLLVASLILAVIGIWASTRAEGIFDRKDAGQIVIDEVCGQVISFIFIAPYMAWLDSGWWWWLIAGFLLFRAFDILKPYPINRLQSLTGGVGVMIDDVLAGIYAAVLLSLALLVVSG